ncbi:DUF551 domain-containing protein [Salmonella enterica]|nr:DUF551 domain-containing protein [Salmonella enterica]EDJ7365673.1 DUF551 domain-containing protein [Salmonella enterica subsp. enterica serovar Muenchen]ECC5777761.1 DUF551 domain-containing protein [Salmonella enterica]ECO8966033.1 DUF551 domain-containing protein [Salmonella enterica]EDN2967218.1 DUF551 domain-containing protein [Salmonella enterica]
MTTITKERIELFIKSPLENGLTRGEQMELARIALASLEAEPVAYIFRHPAGELFWSLTDESNKDQNDVMPVYAAPPVPVVPEEITDESTEQRLMGRRWAHSFCAGWNACRAAMLQSKYRDLSQPVDPQISEYERIMLQAGNSPVIPDGWISCSERMPAQDDWVLIYSKHGEYLAGQVQGEYVELNDGTLSWLGSALHWMLLPEPPQEVK